MMGAGYDRKVARLAYTFTVKLCDKVPSTDVTVLVVVIREDAGRSPVGVVGCHIIMRPHLSLDNKRKCTGRTWDNVMCNCTRLSQ